MKNFLILLLFVPVISFSQISYKDVMSIDSKDTFLKIMVENKYSTTSTSEYSFALNPDEYGSSTSFAQYFLNNRFYFEFVRTGTRYTGTPQEIEIIMENPYDTIFEIIKRKCKYVAVKKVDNLNYACYECKKAKYDGLIALTTSGKKGIITAFAR